MIDIVSIFALIILVLSVFTLVLGFAAYLAFKVRQARGKSIKVHGDSNQHTEAIFLKRYMPESIAEVCQQDSGCDSK